MASGLVLLERGVEKMGGGQGPWGHALQLTGAPDRFWQGSVLPDLYTEGSFRLLWVDELEKPRLEAGRPLRGLLWCSCRS